MTSYTYETYYVAYMPGGGLWCETNSVEELIRQGLKYIGPGHLSNMQRVTKIERHPTVEEKIPLDQWMAANHIVGEELKEEEND